MPSCYHHPRAEEQPPRFGPSVFDVRAVSVELLPETRETLFLRLLGTGKVLEKVLAEQPQLDADAPERRATRRR